MPLFDHLTGNTANHQAGSRQHRLYGHPPFSVWDTKARQWQLRRRKWLDLGIQSELGRGEELTYAISKKYRKINNQTSVFDPVLCELVYGWWCPPRGRVLDPFAGGSVRGLVAATMGRRYLGIELRGEQVKANRAQGQARAWGAGSADWRVGDSLTWLKEHHGKGKRTDMVFSCPPYGNLETYSDHPADISGYDYGRFLEAYSQIIYRACARLRDNRFACFVVGNYREEGMLRDLVGDTVRAFTYAGLSYYNDIVLLNSVGTGAMRVNTNFKRGHRKVVKLHQNILVFVKGDPERAAAQLDPLGPMEAEDEC